MSKEQIKQYSDYAKRLKPCPKCGNIKLRIVSDRITNKKVLYFVKCDVCDILLPGNTIDNAIAAWNTWNGIDKK